MKEFIKNMLSSSEEVSIKRVITALSFLTLVGMVIADGCGKEFSDSLIYVFASLAGGATILSTLEKFRSNNDNNTTATTN